ncbi:MAG: chlorite dismutase family protein [Thermoleophilia bacterium]
MSESESEGTRPSQGWGVVHLFLRTIRGGPAEPVLRAVEAFTATDPNQVIAFSVLGGGADVGLLALGPDLDQLDVFTKAVLDGPVDCVDSFVSLTELSEYTTTEDDERARLQAEGAEDIEAALVQWNARMAEYRKHRLYPRLPQRKCICFYPMAKTRIPGANWYALDFAERKRLMLGHGTTGRSYQGRVLQLITGCTGLDDWEWGVTLLADDPVSIKDIVYEMRFDEVSALYGEFGQFWTGLVMDPASALTRAGLTQGD